ncbi:UvrD-like helicase C-terminal domain [Fragilaria crotonensis]|nr:UvrD-like helicase C-terminal domain [Fragilaria crotonensis]
MLCILLSTRHGSSFSSNIRFYLNRDGSYRFLSSLSQRFEAHNYLHNLNDAQIEAVTQPLEGITRVVAGPGAGKTKVLTCRIAHLLREDPTNKILAVTFTKKASGEMQERLKKILQEEHGDVDEFVLSSSNGFDEDAPVLRAVGFDRVNLGTFHSICAKILRWNGKELSSLPSVMKDLMGSGMTASLDSSFAIIDQSDQLRFVRELMKEKGIDLTKEKELKAQSVLSAMAKVKAGNLDPKEVRRSRLLSIATEIFPRYREQLLLGNALDFDDLISLTAELLNVNGTIRDSLRRRWPHVLVDEFQDTSEVQLDLVKMLTSKSLLVVGDADQSIYSWRGAHVESMSDFGRAFPAVHTVYLMENYRSTTNIVHAAQKVIAGSKSTSAKDLRQAMKPMRGSGSNILVRGCANAKAEASYVVGIVQEMIEKSELLPHQTVAILYRTNAQSRALEEACVSKNLPYVVRGATGAFYDRAEIKDCLCFLRWLRNGRDQSAMLRAFKTPSKGLGDKGVSEFQAYCRAVEKTYAEENIPDVPSPLDLLIAMTDERVSIIDDAPTPDGYISRRTYKPLASFSMKMSAIVQRANKESVSELIKSVVTTIGLEDHFNAISNSQGEFSDRLSNVEELRQAAERYTNGRAALIPPDDDIIEGSPLSNFLDDVSLFTDVAEEREGFKVNLMTIHAAKGMEFDVVFVVGNEDGTFPTTQAVQEGDGSVALDEERRLCYVAMTRAKNRLFLTWRKEVSFFQGDGLRTTEREPSRFLNVLLSKKGIGSNGTSTAPQRRSFSSTTEEARTPTSGSYKYELADMSGKLDAQLQRAKRGREGVKSIGEIRAILRQSPPPMGVKQKISSSRPTESRPITVPKADGSGTRQARKPIEETKPDSTWFFPVGSSVVHREHGPGKILPPPADRNGEMMVRVKFMDGKQIDLPAMTRDLFPN